MRLTCTVCYDVLSFSHDVHAAPCGHLLHYHCWVGWLERIQNCPECRKATRPNQLIKLFFNTQDGDDFLTINNKYDALKCELQCKITELRKANIVLDKQTSDIEKLNTIILRSENKIRELERCRDEFELPVLKTDVKDRLEKFWFNELVSCREAMRKMQESKDAELETLKLELKKYKENELPSNVNSEAIRTAQRNASLRGLPRGCILHLCGFPDGQNDIDHVAICEAIENVGGHVAHVTYNRGDVEAFVRLHAGNRNPAYMLTMKLRGKRLKIGNLKLLLTVRVLEGEEEKNFMIRSLEDKDRRRAEQKLLRQTRNYLIAEEREGRC